MRSYILLTACFGLGVSEETSSLIQLQSRGRKLGQDPSEEAKRACKKACRKDCNKDKGCRDMDDDLKEKCKQSCKKTCRSAFVADTEQCTSYALSAVARKCKRSFKKSCVRECTDDECKTKCRKSAKKAWTGSDCNAFTSTRTAAPAPGRDPNVVVDGKRYYVHEEPRSVTYEQGKQYCADTGGQVASIHTKAENDAVLTLLHGRSSYIGATRVCNNLKCQQWTWDDGSKWVEPKWATDGLNSNKGSWRSGTGNETHIVIHSDSKWHDWAEGESIKDVLCQAIPSQPDYAVPAVPDVHVCGEWSAWGECSATCGGGWMTREYSFLDGNKCGVDCPHGHGEKQQRKCNTAPCAVDCEGGWTQYSACTKSCGGGVQTRMYNVTKQAKHGGKACPKAHGAIEDHACSTEPCEKDCQGHWGDWGECSNDTPENCGPGGSQSRSFVVTQEHTSGGCECQAEKATGGYGLEVVDGNTVDTQSCELPCCAVDCKGSWGAWGQCTGDNVQFLEGDGYGEVTCCGGGKKTRTFTVTEPMECGGECCIASDGQVDEAECCQADCPVDCEGHWTEFGECCVDCGGGIKEATFIVTQPALHGGQECEAKAGDVKHEVCNEHPCPIPCVGEWLAWEECTKECGPDGDQTRRFQVTQNAKHGGKQCEDIGKVEIRPCDPEPKPCPVDAVCDWTEYGECDADCRDSDSQVIWKHRKWVEIKPAKHGGLECKNSPPMAYDGTDPSKAKCEKPRCPIPCIGSWSEYTACNAQIANPGGHFCGGGSKTKTFIITREAQFGGKECNHTHMQKESKSCGDCPCPENCEGHWTEWGACGATCGGSSQAREFVVTKPAKHGGNVCEHEHGHVEHRPCGEQCCPVNCEGQWSDWDQCTEECQDCRHYGAIGTQKQTFMVSVPAECNGQQCPFEDGDVREQNCNEHCCPQDCEGSWGEFGECSTTCGNGVHEKIFTITHHAAFGGKKCDFADGCSFTEQCPGTSPCPIDCKGFWDVFGRCSAECGVDGNVGIRKSHFIELQQAQHGGAECEHDSYLELKTSDWGSVYQTKECSIPTSECPKCIGQWGQWSKCSLPCGGGKKTRTFTVHRPAVGGQECEYAEGDIDEASCNVHACPVGYDCPEGEDCATYEAEETGLWDRFKGLFR